MKRAKNLLRKLKEKMILIGTTTMGSLILTESRVFADSNTQSIDSFINFACDWLTKIGGVISWWCNVCAWLAKRGCRR